MVTHAGMVFAHPLARAIIEHWYVVETTPYNRAGIDNCSCYADGSRGPGRGRSVLPKHAAFQQKQARRASARIRFAYYKRCRGSPVPS